MATVTALAKERFHYFACFYGILLFGLPIGAMKSQNFKLLIPLVPLSFGFMF